MAKVLKAREMNKCLGCFACMTICSVVNKKNHSIIKSSIKVRTTGGMASQFVAVVCIGCEEPACMEVCPADALEKRKGGGVILDSPKCIGCRKCIGACIVRAVNFDEDTHKPIICHHCGMCARFCPHDCLQMVEVEGCADA